MFFKNTIIMILQLLLGSILINIFLIPIESDSFSYYVPSLFRDFNDYDSIILLYQIVQFLHNMKQAHPNKIRINNLGYTQNNNKIYLVKVSYNQHKATQKPIIFIDAGTHAREWLTVSVCLYIIHQLVANKQNEHLLQNIDWYFIPLINPDGYLYSHNKNRYWRKNMAKGHKCRGVDLNRNFGYHWGEIGASTNECSSIYAGPKPFSEIETQTLRNVALIYKERIKLYTSLHTFGELIIYPWGYLNESVSEEFEEEHNHVGNLVVDAINSVRGSQYKTGRQSSILYMASGVNIDWMAAIAKIPLNYIIEMNRNDWKFEPPAEEILPIAMEIFEGYKIFHDYVETKWSTPEDNVPT